MKSWAITLLDTWHASIFNRGHGASSKTHNQAWVIKLFWILPPPLGTRFKRGHCFNQHGEQNVLLSHNTFVLVSETRFLGNSQRSVGSVFKCYHRLKSWSVQICTLFDHAVLQYIACACVQITDNLSKRALDWKTPLTLILLSDLPLDNETWWQMFFFIEEERFSRKDLNQCCNVMNVVRTYIDGNMKFCFLK